MSIHLCDPALNQARIAQRVSEGGHHVPDDKVISRIPGALKLIKKTLPLCDYVYILDNSRADNPFQQLTVIRNGCVTFRHNVMSDWGRELLADIEVDR